MQHQDQLTPHGRIIETARLERRLSKRAAAGTAHISEGRWRQIVTGVQKVGGGRTIPVNTTPETLVAMARAVGAATDDVLVAAGMDPIGAVEVQTSPERPLAAYPHEALLHELDLRLRGVTGNAKHPASIVTGYAPSADEHAPAPGADQPSSPAPGEQLGPQDSGSTQTAGGIQYGQALPRRKPTKGKHGPSGRPSGTR